jgi:hypothetical protein
MLLNPIEVDGVIYTHIAANVSFAVQFEPGLPVAVSGQMRLYRIEDDGSITACPEPELRFSTSDAGNPAGYGYAMTHRREDLTDFEIRMRFAESFATVDAAVQKLKGDLGYTDLPLAA